MNKASEHVHSWYAASANPAPSLAPLEGELDCDVCVVGGGVSGCSAALHLAERGYDTVLLEAQRIGWGASGRSGGQVLPGFACAQDRLERMLDPATARQLWDMSVEAVELVREQVSRASIDCGLRSGHLHAATRGRQKRELETWKHELEDRYAYSGLRLVEGAELAGMLATRRYVAGLYDPRSLHLHPLNYTLGLAAAARGAGVRMFESSAVEHYAEQDGGVRVQVGVANVRCRHLLLCCNAYAGGLSARMRARIMPVGTYIVATRTLGEDRARLLIPNEMAVADTNFVLDYFRCSHDHRLLFGGRVSYSTLDPPSVAQSVRRRMLRVFPQLADTEIEYAWGGYVAITLNRAPHFGRLGDHVYFVQGFSGHGMALSGLAGKLLAEAVAGTAERFDIFARIPHLPFPGGRALRTPLLVLAMAWYRLRDLMP